MNKFYHAARIIKAAMPQALSIDNYLDAHRGDSDIELVGKVAIAKTILEAERASKMSFDPKRETEPQFDKLEDTWYTRFFQALTEGISRDELDDVFNQVSFITFNYDRCIGHFLLCSLENYYRISEQQSRDIIRTIRIFHPFGVVGALEWQELKDTAIAFGSAERGPSLVKCAEQIKTFNERIHEQAALDAIRAEVENAEVIVFLGFAFHPQNMELLHPERTCAMKRIFATAKNISKSDCDEISLQLSQKFIRMKSGRAVQVDIRDLTCRALFDEYWRTLTRI